MSKNIVKIATWNINSIRSRLPNILKWIKQAEPDILLLQELKCEEELFPREQLEDAGYNVVVNGQRTFNGVAILSKFPIDEVIKGLPSYGIDDKDNESRYIEAAISLDKHAVRVASVYVPNGAQMEMKPGQKVNETERFAYKMRFYDRLRKHFKNLLKYNEIAIFGGDYNTCPEIFDMYKPEKDGEVCCHIDERKKFRALLNLGLADSFRIKNPDKQEFTWWDYRTRGWEAGRGLRLDHLLTSPMATDRLVSVEIAADETRGEEKPSDHAPVICELDI